MNVLVLGETGVISRAIVRRLLEKGNAVTIYNRAGRLVREVENGRTMNAGANLVRWNGEDQSGEIVPDGLYLISVEALGEKQVKTLAVVR